MVRLKVMTRWIVLVVAALVGGCSSGSSVADDGDAAPAAVVATDASGDADSASDAAAGPDVEAPDADASASDAARVTCEAGATVCEGASGSRVCVDTQIDPRHCGYCGNACAAGQACSAGTCR